MGKAILTVFILVCQAAVVFSQTRADDILGYYLAHDPNSGNKAQMEIYKTAAGKYEVKVVWKKNYESNNARKKNHYSPK